MILDSDGRLIVAGTAMSSDPSYSSFAVACYDPGVSNLPVQMQYTPPVLRMVVPDQVTSVGQTLNLPTLGMFTSKPDATSFNYTIDWGDGTTPNTPTGTIITSGGGSALLVGSFGGSHTYESGRRLLRGRHRDRPQQRLGHPDHPGDGGLAMAFQTTDIPAGTVNAGQTYTLPSVAFSDTACGHPHGDHRLGRRHHGRPPTTYRLTEPSFDSSQLAVVPGSFPTAMPTAPAAHTPARSP